MSNRTFVETSPQIASSTPAQTTQGTDAAVVLAANPKRKGLLIQNTGTTVILLTFGAVLPTTTVYQVALPACTAINDGKGGIYFDESWVGVVNALSSASGGTMVITEFKTGLPDWNQASDWGTMA
jgi:hypothetical protein